MPTPIVAPIGALKVRVLNGVVNREEKSHRFLTDMIFPPSTHVLLGTEDVQIDEEVFSPIMAPFIETNGEAVMMPRSSGSSYTVKTPNISLKEPLTASAELLKRTAGQSSILTGTRGDNQVKKNLQRLVAKDTKIMISAIGERTEWMVSNILRGALTYSVDNRTTFSLTLAKPAGNTVTPSVYWDVPATATFLTDIMGIKRIQNENNGPGLTDAICSTTASTAIMEAVETGDLSFDKTRNVPTGEFTGFLNDFNAQGVLFLGTIAGIRFWEYGQSVTEEDGTTTEKLIREDYIEFLSLTREFRDMNDMYYGVILDFEAIENDLHIARRFSKVELKTDPSVYVQYMKSRPLPVLKRPDWNVSFIAVTP